MARAATLSPSARMTAGGGPIQARPASRDRLGEAGVLGQEAVARVDGFRAGLSGRRQQRGDVEVGVRGGRSAQWQRLVG
jgi:hypothetical protein